MPIDNSTYQDGSEMELAILQWRNFIDVTLDSEERLRGSFLTFENGDKSQDVIYWFQSTFNLSIDELRRRVSEQHGIPFEQCYPQIVDGESRFNKGRTAESLDSITTFADLIRESRWVEAFDFFETLPRVKQTTEMARAGFMITHPHGTSIYVIIDAMRKKIEDRNRTSPLRKLTWDQYLVHLRGYLLKKYEMTSESIEQLFEKRLVAMMTAWVQGWNIPRTCKYLVEPTLI